jgi:hypothetical protein
MKRATMNRYELGVTIPEPSSVLSAALADTGVTFTLSDKGKYAQALLARAPGLEELVRQPGALEVIADLTRKRNDRFKKELQKILQDGASDTAPVEAILALARETVPLPHQPAAELPKHNPGHLGHRRPPGATRHSQDVLTRVLHRLRGVPDGELRRAHLGHRAGHVPGMRGKRCIPRGCQ